MADQYVGPYQIPQLLGDENVARVSHSKALAAAINNAMAGAAVATKCVRLEAGKWVWDTTNGTHYVIPDATGSLVVRATAQPVPTSTPVLNW